MDPLYDKVCFGTSRLVTRRYSTSFSIGVRCLGREIRDAVYGVYGFVRIADEIVDTFLEEDREALLDEFEAEYYRALERGISTNPVIHAFCRVVRRYRIDDSLVRAFLESMRMDLHRNRYTEDELGEYIFGSAEVVGLICLQIFVQGDRERYRQLESYARRLGAAFQKVNFLRDLKDDREALHRIYFPQLKNGTLTEEVKKRLLDDIYEDFSQAREGIRRLPDCARLGVYTAYLYYLALARAIAATPCERLSETRIRISNLRKLLLFGRAYLTRKSLRTW
uniref:phytoene/squalene synthase family protein n=1 Tax=Alistipes onderdonkii TaxID=328813 RepID=UPI00402A080C